MFHNKHLRKYPALLVYMCLISIFGIFSLSTSAFAESKPDSSKWERHRVENTQEGTLQFRGIVESANTVNVSGPGPYDLIESVKRDGAAVKKGEVILRWDMKQVEIKLAQQKELLAHYQNQLGRLEDKRTQERMQHLIKLNDIQTQIEEAESALEVEKGVVALGSGNKQRLKKLSERLKRLQNIERLLKKAVKDSETQREPASAGEIQAKILQVKHSIEDTKLLLNKAETKAPIDGIIQALQPLSPGPMKAGSVLRILDRKDLLVSGMVWQNEFVLLQEGQKATVRPDYMPDQACQGHVSIKAPYGVLETDPATGVKLSRFKVFIKLDTSSSVMLPGMSVLAIVNIGDWAALVPQNFVLFENQITFVYKKTADGYRKAIIKLLASNKDGMQLVQGVSKGDILLRPPAISSKKKP